jgi:hypothetical protein
MVFLPIQSYCIWKGYLESNSVMFGPKFSVKILELGSKDVDWRILNVYGKILLDFFLIRFNSLQVFFRINETALKLPESSYTLMWTVGAISEHDEILLAYFPNTVGYNTFSVLSEYA